jgi:penicillin-binding protein 1A
MTVANASFVNGGVFVSPTFIARIEDKLGNVIYTPKTVIRQGLDERTAYTVLQMMKGVVDGAYSIETGNRKGTAMRIRGDRADREYDGIRAPMAGKTGTTQNNTDGWFIGLTPDLVTGVWVGAQDPTVRFSTTTLGQGANTGLPIYGYYMKAVYANEEVGLSRRDFDRPRVLGPDSLECSKVIRELRPRDASGPGEEELEELFGD